MIVWPFITITLGLTFLLGYAITQIESDKIMKNWDNRRCDLPIMTMAGQFKPPEDPRTSGQFASDNFGYCMDKIVKDVTYNVLTPILSVFGQQGYVAATIGEVMNSVRYIMHVMYEQFISYISGFLQKYNIIAQQVRTVTLHLKQAFQRVNSIILSLVFAGLSIIRGIMNSVDFVIKVVIIILAILVALIFVLFFVMFPFIPLILSVILAIVAVAVGAMAGQAASYGNSFCFAPHTLIRTENGAKFISEIKIGDRLYGGSIVESVIRLSGKNTKLWRINGIYVSGTHLVEKSPMSGKWHPVAKDNRAVYTHYTEGYIYCLNTSDHVIPVMTNSLNMIRFRDWEEIDSDDFVTQEQWNNSVFQKLNGELPTDNIISNVYPSLSPRTEVVTPFGNKQIAAIKIGDIVIDQNGAKTAVLATIKTITPAFGDGMIYRYAGKWIRINLPQSDIIQNDHGYNIITAEGTFLAIYNNERTIFRDFTEVGHASIKSVNKCVESKLRTN